MNNHSEKAGVLSILFMGLGQLYNKQYFKGFFFALIEIFFIILMLPFTVKSLRGLITLGDTPQKMVNGKIIQGDHSIFLMVFGIISLLVLFIFAVIYVINVKDAYRVGMLRDEGKKPNNIRDSLHVLYDRGFPYLLLTPAAIFTLFLTVLPLIFGIMIAFTNYSSPNHLPPRSLVDWVGFENFINLFKLPSLSRTFFGVALWTVTWAVLATVTTFFVGLFFAVLINSNGIVLKKFWRTIYILPWAVPGFISILIMRNMFNGQFGPINKYLQAIGINPIPWFADPTWAKITCILVNLWFGFPYYMALMSGVITGISKDLYEAASIEGASARQQFWKITLPMVLFATAPLLIMGFAYNFNNFTLIYLLTSGNPTNATYNFAGHTDILLSWLYKLTLEQNQFHMASVVSILIFIVIAIISVINFRNTRSFKEEDMIQ
ncbi:MAG: arabinogalactan oligomer / maltooligosaccharide transport system permease protein [Petroclostridium sp.]|nr:sugar transporter permease [Clostridia bacterium]MDK2809379.1 arabinogalactan oligomer / maltooligosaccharide transport system permease protein [Petroclostridium sp.]